MIDTKIKFVRFHKFQNNSSIYIGIGMCIYHNLYEDLFHEVAVHSNLFCFQEFR